MTKVGADEHHDRKLVYACCETVNIALDALKIVIADYEREWNPTEARPILSDMYEKLGSIQRQFQDWEAAS